MELALFFQQCLNFDIILVQPVLVVSCSQAEPLEGNRVSCRLQRIPVCAGGLFQVVVQGFSEFMLYRGDFEVVDVEHLRNFLCLRLSLGLDI